jgi:hypothetical protein
MTSQAGVTLHTVSIVVPVYQGELTLEPLLVEIEPLITSQSTPGGARFYAGNVDRLSTEYTPPHPVTRARSSWICG